MSSVIRLLLMNVESVVEPGLGYFVAIRSKIFEQGEAVVEGGQPGLNASERAGDAVDFGATSVIKCGARVMDSGLPFGVAKRFVLKLANLFALAGYDGGEFLEGGHQQG